MSGGDLAKTLLAFVIVIAAITVLPTVTSLEASLLIIAVAIVLALVLDKRRPEDRW